MRDIDPGTEFADNPEPRCACVLLVDTSGSMCGAPLAELNQGLQVLQQSLASDRVARLRVEVAIVSFGADDPDNPGEDVYLAQNFVDNVLIRVDVTSVGDGYRPNLSNDTALRLAFGTIDIAYRHLITVKQKL